MIFHRLTASRLAPLLTLALLASACQSEGKGAATGQNITRAADAITTGIGQLDATLSSLTSLVNQPAPDLGPQYKAFSSNLDALDATAKQVRDANAGMAEKGKAYFAEWDAQIAAIQNEDIRERSVERRKLVEEELAKIKVEYEQARDTFNPLMNDLKDIRTALGTDLTMDGLAAVKKTVGKSSGRGEDVKKALEKLAESFRKVGVRLSNSGPAAPAPAPQKK